MTRTELITKGVDLKYTYRCPWISIHPQPVKVPIRSDFVVDDLRMSKMNMKGVIDDLIRKLHVQSWKLADPRKYDKEFVWNYYGWKVTMFNEIYSQDGTKQSFNLPYPALMAIKNVELDGEPSNLWVVSIGVLTSWK